MTLFPEDMLAQLPLTFRFMTPIESSTFEENCTEYRFGRSLRHFSGQYISLGSYKPLSNIIYEDFLTQEP